MPKVQKGEIYAVDLMKRDVLRLDADTLITEAMSTLEENGIGGAPVVDGADRLVGVFSMRDALRAGALSAGRLGERAGDDRIPDWSDDETDDGFAMEEEISDRDDYSSGSAGGNRVADWMNPTVIAVRPDAPLAEVCRVLTRERIHRTFVVEGKRLLGVISTSDIVRTIAERGTV